MPLSKLKSQNKKITTLFWDLGGVLFSDAHTALNPESDPLLQLFGLTPQQHREIFFRMWDDQYQLGKISEDEFWQAFIQESKNHPPLAQVKETFRKSRMQPNWDTLAIVKQLSQKYDQYILSNHSKEWMDYLARRWKLKQYFKDIFCSGYLGVCKPDKRFCLIALEKTGKKPHEILYIDDREQNIKAAEALGIQSILYRGIGSLKESSKIF